MVEALGGYGEFVEKPEDIRPAIHATMPLTDAREGFQAMLEGDIVGKVVFTV